MEDEQRLFSESFTTLSIQKNSSQFLQDIVLDDQSNLASGQSLHKLETAWTKAWDSMNTDQQREFVDRASMVNNMSILSESTAEIPSTRSEHVPSSRPQGPLSVPNPAGTIIHRYFPPIWGHPDWGDGAKVTIRQLHHRKKQKNTCAVLSTNLSETKALSHTKSCK